MPEVPTFLVDVRRAQFHTPPRGNVNPGPAKKRDQITMAFNASTYKPISPEVTSEEIAKWTRESRRQTDGAGLRVGNRSEFTALAPVIPGTGAATFRQRVEKAQIEAPYWEGRLGTVHDLRVALILDETYLLFAASYSDEFRPYVADVIKFAAPWIDYMFKDVALGYPGLESPEALEYLAKHQVEASVWYASPNPDASVRDVSRALQVSGAFNSLLDAAQM
jgi:hypothetical protein